MPVLARSKVVIEEPCLRTPTVSFEYKGPNPQEIYKKIKKLIPVVFKIDEHEIEERNFLWDRSSSEEKFRTTFNFIKEFDQENYAEINIHLEGKARPSKDFGKEGEAKVTVDAKVRTEYPHETLTQRIIFGIYRRMLGGVHAKRRAEYRKRCSELVSTFCEELKSFLNILLGG